MVCELLRYAFRGIRPYPLAVGADGSQVLVATEASRRFHEPVLGGFGHRDHDLFEATDLALPMMHGTLQGRLDAVELGRRELSHPDLVGDARHGRLEHGLGLGLHELLEQHRCGLRSRRDLEHSDRVVDDLYRGVTQIVTGRAEQPRLGIRCSRRMRIVSKRWR